MKVITLLILSCTLVLSACKSKKKMQSPEEVKQNIDNSVDDMLGDLDDEDMEWMEPMKTPAIRPHYNPSEKRVNDLIHTKLEVSFNWQKHYLNGIATLDFKPYFYPVDSLILDAKGMDIHKVSLVPSKNKYTTLKYRYDGMLLRIKLDKQYTRNETYKIYIEYTAKPDEYEMGGSSAISGDKGLYFINSDSTEAGKPTQIWTQGETEASSRWFPTIDAPNEKTTQEIEITIDKGFKTLSNGLLEFSTDNGDGTRTDYWKQSLPHAPYLFMMAIGDFAVVSDYWQKADGKKISVDYYVEKEYEKYARDIFGETPNMLEYFSDLLGVEYQWEKYAQVVVRDYVSGAMENTSATIHGDFLHRTKRELIDGHNESIIAHELFHHWFGDLVTCESWSNLPLNESFANYSQFLWDEHKHGPDEAAYQAKNEMDTYIAVAARGEAVDLIRFGYEDKEEMFDAVSYNKGGRILHMLRKYVGDEAFFLSLKNYLNKYKFQAVEVEQLRLEFENVTGEDLHWYFDQWFLGKGHPQLNFETKVDSVNQMVTIITRQMQDTESLPVFKLPITVDIYSTNIDGLKAADERTRTSVQKERQILWVDAVADTMTFSYKGKHLRLVNIDADQVMLAEMEIEMSKEERIFQFYNAPLFLDRKEGLLACKNSSNETCVQVHLDALNDSFWAIRELAIRNIRKAARKNGEAVKTKLKDLVENDPKSSVRATAISALEKHFGSKEDLTAVFEKGVKDPSYYVVSVAIQSLAEKDLDKAYKTAKELEGSESSSIKTTIGDIYAEKGLPEDNTFYMDNWQSIGGFEKISFLKTYSNYLQSQDDDVILKGMDVFAEVAKNGSSMWEKYFSGYQTIIQYRSYFYKKKTSLSDDIKKLESSGAATDAILKQTELKKATEMYTSIDTMLTALRVQETNEQVIELIDSGASMDFIDE